MIPRLLVIDDEQDLLLIYQLIFEPEGYDIRLASSGLQVSQEMIIEQFHPDLIILDYHLERNSWNEPLLRQMKADPSLSAIPLILCTGDANVLQEQEGFLREVNVRVVLKPFEIDVLLHTVQQALQERVV